MGKRQSTSLLTVFFISLLLVTCKPADMITSIPPKNDSMAPKEIMPIKIKEIISAHEFEGRDDANFKYVKIEGENKRIPNWAFAIVPALETVILNNKIGVVEDNSFFSCKNLSTINLENVDSIGESAFKFTKIQTANLENVTMVGEFAFSDCPLLQKVLFSKKLKQLGDFAFSNDTLLIECIIPSGIIGANTFMGCSNLETIEASQVSFIGKAAFLNCQSLSSITLSPELESIEELTFYGCRNLRNISLPQNLKTIGDFAFWGTSIDVLEIPASVSKIGNSAFAECKNLKKVVLNNPDISIAESAFDKSIIIENNY